MSYLTQDEIANNRPMLSRVAQCVAGQPGPPVAPAPVSDPDRWAYDHRRVWAAAPGWDAAWESAKVSHPDDSDGGTSYDPGTDAGVITDGQILAQIQAMLGPAA